MKNSGYKLIIALMALLLCGISFADSIHSEVADGSSAIRFQNIGSELVTINIFQAGAAATNTVVIGSTSNTIDGSGTTDTVTEFAAAIAACTNSAGKTVLIMDTRCALGADSTDAELLTGAYTAAAVNGSKQYWGELLWDTSAHLSYDVYIPAARQADSGVRSDIDIDQIYGNPLGTGDGTLSIYIDGTLSWQMQNTELFLATNAVATPVGIPALTKSVLVRATRASTATTGMIGVVAAPTVQQ